MASKSPIATTPHDRQDIDADAFCPRCGYNLRGLSEGRCPECGEAFDAAGLAVSRIPWTQHKRLGSGTAYWRTVWMVTFRPGRFCDELGRPVAYDDARHFRWVTVAHVYIPLFFVSQFLVHYLMRPLGIETDLARAPGVYLGSMAFLQVLLLLLLIALTGSPGWFFHPRGLSIKLQNRGVAMSLYACAPLAWFLPALLLAALALFEGNLWDVWSGGGPRVGRVIAFGLVGITGLMAVAIPLAWWTALVRLARRMGQHYSGSWVRAAVFVPLVWLLWAILIFLGIPLLAVFLTIVRYSFG